MQNFNNYIFRASSLGKIMSAKGELTQSNKTYLRELFTEIMEGKRKEISSKYFEKGNFMEEDGISIVNSALYPERLLTKNKTRLKNEWVSGECDLVAPDNIIYDIKNAWDVFTFGKADLTDDYEWQGRAYLWLWDKKRFRLFYCLNNMPEHLLVDEERKMFFRHSFVTMEDAEFLKLCVELRAFHNYDNRPLENRFKVWDVEHSDAEIEKLKAKIIKCREFLNQLLQEYNDRLVNNRRLMGGSPAPALSDVDLLSNLVKK